MTATVPTLLDIDALSSVISLAPQTIKNMLSKNPAALPPRVVIPGVRSVRFHSDDVVSWIKDLQRSFTSDLNESSGTKTPTAQTKRRVGRPTKAEVLARTYNNQN